MTIVHYKDWQEKIGKKLEEIFEEEQLASTREMEKRMVGV
ncbi:15279_t:CDS:2 [Cetraspora pellucida]|uniref:15279_t:CDS:1 n=1 Tax=Cetraspora pellucida TaxID=1433469 RepID=A0A9N8YX60_9GLOM|nr:15279_t:CDS:2 [Cetraspora pellucida]